MPSTRIMTVAVEADDTTLSDFAAYVQAKINDACAGIESCGGRILGAVSIAPMRATWSSPIEGSHRDDHHAENGVVAAITYETD